MLAACTHMNESPNQGLQISDSTTSTAGQNQKWISRTPFDSKVVILYSFIGHSHFFVVIAGKITLKHLSATECIQEDSL